MISSILASLSSSNIPIGLKLLSFVFFLSSALVYYSAALSIITLLISEFIAAFGASPCFAALLRIELA